MVIKYDILWKNRPKLWTLHLDSRYADGEEESCILSGLYIHRWLLPCQTVVTSTGSKLIKDWTSFMCLTKPSPLKLMDVLLGTAWVFASNSSWILIYLLSLNCIWKVQVFKTSEVLKTSLNNPTNQPKNPTTFNFNGAESCLLLLQYLE